MEILYCHQVEARCIDEDDDSSFQSFKVTNCSNLIIKLRGKPDLYFFLFTGKKVVIFHVPK